MCGNIYCDKCSNYTVNKNNVCNETMDPDERKKLGSKGVRVCKLCFDSTLKIAKKVKTIKKYKGRVDSIDNLSQKFENLKKQMMKDL